MQLNSEKASPLVFLSSNVFLLVLVFNSNLRPVHTRHNLNAYLIRYWTMRIKYASVPSTLLKKQVDLSNSRGVSITSASVSSQVPSPFLLKEAATASIKLYYLNLERNKLCFASTLIRAHCERTLTRGHLRQCEFKPPNVPAWNNAY